MEGVLYKSRWTEGAGAHLTRARVRLNYSEHCTAMPPRHLLASTLVAAALLALAAAAPGHDTSEARQPGNGTDLAALLAFKAALSDPLGVLRHNWSGSAAVCDWVGVSCGSRRHPGRVTSVALPDMALQGQVAPSIGNLSFLSVLNLTNASLTGPIPSAFGRLRRLRYLVLNQNSLSGSIPGAIGNLTSLQILDLYHNKLAG